MVAEINPNYYAGGVLNTGFNLMGSDFDVIPSDAVGLYARYNDNPLEFRYSLSPSLLYSITEKTNEAMSLESNNSETTHGKNYLGAIVSNDRSTIYWVNNTKPLP